MPTTCQTRSALAVGRASGSRCPSPAPTYQRIFLSSMAQWKRSTSPLFRRAGVRSSDLSDFLFCRGIRRARVVWLALILTFSPWEKERPSSIVGFADDGPAHPVAHILKKDRRYTSISSEETENGRLCFGKLGRAYLASCLTSTCCKFFVRIINIFGAIVWGNS
jgi:hypothetical protein